MIVLVDERTDVSDAYKTSIGREGYSVASFSPPEFIAWFNSLGEPDLNAVDAFVLAVILPTVSTHITAQLKRRVHVPLSRSQ